MILQVGLYGSLDTWLFALNFLVFVLFDSIEENTVLHY